MDRGFMTEIPRYLSSYTKATASTNDGGQIDHDYSACPSKRSVEKLSWDNAKGKYAQPQDESVNRKTNNVLKNRINNAKKCVESEANVKRISIALPEAYLPVNPRNNVPLLEIVVKGCPKESNISDKSSLTCSSCSVKFRGLRATVNHIISGECDKTANINRTKNRPIPDLIGVTTTKLGSNFGGNTSRQNRQDAFFGFDAARSRIQNTSTTSNGMLVPGNFNQLKNRETVVVKTCTISLDESDEENDGDVFDTAVDETYFDEPSYFTSPISKPVIIRRMTPPISKPVIIRRKTSPISKPVIIRRKTSPISKPVIIRRKTNSINVRSKQYVENPSHYTNLIDNAKNKKGFGAHRGETSPIFEAVKVVPVAGSGLVERIRLFDSPFQHSFSSNDPENEEVIGGCRGHHISPTTNIKKVTKVAILKKRSDKSRQVTKVDNSEGSKNKKNKGETKRVKKDVGHVPVPMWNVGNSGKYTCHFCLRNFNTRGGLSRHVKIHFKFSIADKKPIPEGGFECLYCKKQLKNRIEYEHHLNAHLLFPEDCNVCGATYSHKVDLAVHIASHKEIKDNESYKCEVCSKTINNRKKYLNHMYKHRDNRMKHQCEICKSYFETRKALILHRGIHSHPMNVEGVIKCTICNDVFQLESAFHKHLEEKHAPSILYPCGECPAKFEFRADLLLHSKSHANLPSKTHVCDICNLSFSSEAVLVVHKWKHKPETESNRKPVKCKKCGLLFTTRYLRDAHLKLTHSGGGNIKLCPICGMSFDGLEAFNKHFRTHQDADNVGSDEILLPCSLCPMKFNTAKLLEKHFKTHKSASVKVESKKRKCQPTVSYKTSRNETLATRKKKQSQKKVISELMECSICASTFRYKKSLTKHILTHEKGASEFSLKKAIEKQPPTKKCRKSACTTATIAKPYDDLLSCSVESFDDNLNTDPAYDIDTASSGDENAAKGDSRNESRENSEIIIILGNELFDQLKKSVDASNELAKTQVEPTAVDLEPRESKKRKVSSFADKTNSKRKRSDVDLPEANSNSNTTVRRTKTGVSRASARVKSLVKKRTNINCGKKKLTSLKTCDEETQIENNSKPSYVCDICHKSLLRKGDLRKHIYGHLGLLRVSCNICGKSFARAANLRKHSVTHSDARVFCYICNKSYSQLYTLKEHILGHLGVKYSCGKCNKSFPNKSKLALHEKKHGEEPIGIQRDDGSTECQRCQDRFGTFDDFQKHLTTMCARKVRCRCGTCGDVYTDLCRAQKHFKGSRIRLWKCWNCTAKFKSNAELIEHFVKKCGERDEVNCDTCRKIFNEECALRGHTKGEEKILKYACSLCSNKYSEKCNLRKHVSAVHYGARLAFCGDKFQYFISYSQQDGSKSKFHCRQCPSKFSHKSFLKQHVAEVHSDSSKSKYVCDICGTVYVLKWKLNFHMKTHTKEHCCEICNARFSYKTNLTAHRLAIHGTPEEKLLVKRIRPSYPKRKKQQQQQQGEN